MAPPLAPPLAPLALQRWSVVAPAVERIAPGRVLEIGCGLGGFGARLAARYDYTAVEQDATSYSAARPGIEAAGGRILHGSHDDVDGSAFDLVCAFEVLEHIEDDDAAVAAWVGRIAPGGWLIVSVPARPDRFGEWDQAVGHYRRYRPDQLEGVLVRAGLQDVNMTHYGWPLGFLTESVRHRLVRRPGQTEKADAMADRTASSGRRFQPRSVTGLAVRAAVAPFLVLQARRPGDGVGLVAVGRKPQ
jgi:SAM-dependent methyltransferase